MKIKIQDIVYRANVREVREKIIRVADFAIPSDKIAASLATEAGQFLISLGVGSWDVLAAPTSDGQSPISDLGLAKKWKLGTAGMSNPIMTNKSGGDLNAGSVVIQDTTNDSAFKTTVTAEDNIIGVLGETIANNLTGSVLQVGLATVLVSGNVAKGDYLCSSTSAGRAKTATSMKGVFGIAMTAYGGGGSGSVTALIWTQGLSKLIGAASGVPTLNGSSLVVQDPANATATPTASKIPIADGSARVNGWITPISAHIFLSAGSMKPQASNGCAPLATTTMATNKQDVDTLDFDAAAVEYAQSVIFKMPDDYNGGTFTAKFIWKHAATATNFGVVWQIEAVAYADDLALDTAWGTAVHVDEVGGTTSDLYISSASGAVTPGGSAAAGCQMKIRISRLATDGSDTMTIDAGLIGVQITYTRTV